MKDWVGTHRQLYWKSIFDTLFLGVIGQGGDGGGTLAVMYLDDIEETLDDLADRFMEHEVPVWNTDGTINGYEKIKDIGFQKENVEHNGEKYINIWSGQEGFVLKEYKEGMVKHRFDDIFIVA